MNNFVNFLYIFYMGKIKNAMWAHISENKRAYFRVLLFILLGFVLGCLIDFTEEDLSMQGQSGFIAFWGFLKINLRFWILILLGGLFVHLRVLVYLANFFKGFSLGFMIKLVLYKYAFKGILLILISNFLHFILFLPIAIYFSVGAIKSGDKRKWMRMATIFLTIIMLFAAFEGFIVPVFVGGLLNLF